MKALVYYCRWQGVSLRLRGRDETAVWGHLVSVNEDGSESSQPFRFELQNGRLTLDDEQTITLDEMGTVIEE
jgi:hypothetical protein